jgi:hypothetical protein
LSRLIFYGSGQLKKNIIKEFPDLCFKHQPINDSRRENSSSIPIHSGLVGGSERLPLYYIFDFFSFPDEILSRSLLACYIRIGFQISRIPLMAVEIKRPGIREVDGFLCVQVD